MFAPQELAALFQIIDRVDGVVNRSAIAARVAADRMDQLQAGYDKRYPEGMAKLSSWFGGKSRASDAPVDVPAWDSNAARIDVASEVAALSAAIGVSQAVQPTTYAFAGEAEVSDDVQDNVESAADLYAPSDAVDSQADNNSAPESVPAVAPPTAAQSTSSAPASIPAKAPKPKQAAATSGEDDEDDSDDDDDDDDSDSDGSSSSSGSDGSSSSDSGSDSESEKE